MNKQPRWMRLALGCVSLALVAWNTDTWTKFVDGRVSVLFPFPPLERTAQQVGLSPQRPGAVPNDRKTGFFVQDTHGAYVLVVNSTAAAHINPEDPVARRAYYDAVCRNTAKREGGTVLDRSFFSTPAGEGTEFSYTGLRVGSRRLVVKYVREVLVGPIGYSLTFLPLDRTDSTGQAGQEQRRRFFDSLTVIPGSDK